MNIYLLLDQKGSCSSLSTKSLQKCSSYLTSGRNLVTGAAVSSQTDNSVQTVSLSHIAKGDVRSAVKPLANNCCSSTESTPRTWATGEMADRGNHGPSLRALPDSAQVYSFIGSVFDPNVTGHLQKLKKMDPIDFERVSLLMRNLSINLTSPDFEEHRPLLSSYEIDAEKDF